MNDFDNYDLAKMDVDLSTLLDDFPADVSTGDTDTSTPMADLLGFSPLGAAFEPRTLAELLEVENQMLDDQGWLWEDGLLESALAMDTPPHNVSRREPRMVAFAETFLVPTKTHNFSKVLCPDFTYSPALSRPAIADSHAVFATQFLLRGQQNKVIIWDMEAAGVAQQIVDVREAAHSFVWLEQGSRVAFACGASIGMMQVGQMWAQRPFYAPVFHEAPIRDMEVCKLGPNKVISGANDGTVFVSDIEHLLSNANEKHNWCARLGTSISSVCYHPRHLELVSVTTDCGVLFTKDLRDSKNFIQRLEPRIGMQAHLFDHVWAEQDILLGYSDGMILRTCMSSGMEKNDTNQTCHPRLVELDSLEELGNGCVGAFGSGGMVCYATGDRSKQTASLAPSYTFVPEEKSFLGHGGTYYAAKEGVVVTAADGSIFSFENCFARF